MQKERNVMKRKYYNVMLNGSVWYGHLTESKADEECIRARQLYGKMFYVEAE